MTNTKFKSCCACALSPEDIAREMREWERYAQERRAQRDAERREQEELWQLGLRSKPRHLRKRWISDRAVGPDTRRRRADGKLLGNHHWHRYYDRSRDNRRPRRERRLAEYARRCFEAGLVEEDFARHININTDWDERKPKPQY